MQSDEYKALQKRDKVAWISTFMEMASGEMKNISHASKKGAKGLKRYEGLPMTVTELRKKHPQETEHWQDEQCQQYCRSLEVLSNVFIDYVEKQLQKKTVDTYAN